MPIHEEVKAEILVTSCNGGPMLIHHINKGYHQSVEFGQLPWHLTEVRNRIESALTPSVHKWVEEQAQRIARDRQNWAWQQVRLRGEIRLKFSPIARAMGVNLSLIEPPLMFAVMASLHDELNSLGDDAQLANVDLQNALQKQQQTLQMMSNISKMYYDTTMSVIRKIGS